MAQESMDQLWIIAQAAAATGKIAAEGSDWDTAREAARVLLSAGSKLHAKLGVLVDLRSDAAWQAAVDRTLAKERRQRIARDDAPAPIPGDVPLGTPPAPKGRGKGKG